MRPSRPASTATGSRPENRLSLTFRLPPSSSADGSGTGGNTRTRGIRILIGESINLIDLSVNYERRLRSNDGWYKRPDLQTPLIQEEVDRKSTRLNSSHSQISYAVFCLKKKKNRITGSQFTVYNSHY